VSAGDIPRSSPPEASLSTGWAAALSAVSAALIATFDIYNTSIGWHLASGRWMLEHGRVLRSDPFSFTASGALWVDHEWLFQVVVAVLESLGGAPALVALRVAVAVALALLLTHFGVRCGMGRWPAALLAVVCVWGARPRLFVRPELATLVLAVVAVGLYLDRTRPTIHRAIALAAVTALGANLHAGILIVPPILTALWLAEIAAAVARRTAVREVAVPGAIAILAASTAPLLNPHGWRLYRVPIEISHLVGLPHIPNPEWISPGPAEAPALWVAMLVSAAILAIGRERELARWALLVVLSALALRHIRNLGLFFVLLPFAVAPTLARTRLLGHLPGGPRLPWWLAAASAVIIAASAAVSPWPPFGVSWAENWYPDRACDALERLELGDRSLYNDVRFGGYLIDRRYPPHRVFLDDRNEIHEPLLREIWAILESSDVRRWEALLERWDLDTALVRYHPTVTVRTPDGEVLGQRGFSALWFRPEGWALVWFDDTAMVLVRRSSVDPELLDRHEYRTFRPDDLQHLARELAADPVRIPAVAEEIRRAAREDPDGQRVEILTRLVAEASELDSQ
jgi:hypothetical protein